MTEGEHEYLTAKEVADLLRVTVKSVSRWASADPSMPALRIGGRVRFHRERLLRWLKSREQGIGRSKQPEKLLTSPIQPIDGQGNGSGEHSACARA